MADINTNGFDMNDSTMKAIHDWAEQIARITKDLKDGRDYVNDASSKAVSRAAQFRASWNRVATTSTSIYRNLQIDKIVKSAERVKATVISIGKEVQKNTGAAVSEWSKFVNDAFVSVRKINQEASRSAFNTKDLLEAANRLTRIGWTDLKSLSNLTPVLATMNKTMGQITTSFNASILSLQKVFKDGTGKLVQGLGDSMAAYSELFGVTASDLQNAQASLQSTLVRLSRGDTDRYSGMTESLNRAIALSSEMGVSGDLMSSMLLDFANMQAAELNQKYGQALSVGGIAPADIQNLVQSGQIDVAVEKLLRGIAKTQTGDIATANMYKNLLSGLGLTDATLNEIANNAKNLDSYVAGLQKASQETDGKMRARLNEMIVPLSERWDNFISSSNIAQAAANFLSGGGISSLIGAVSNIANMYTGFLELMELRRLNLTTRAIALGRDNGVGSSDITKFISGMKDSSDNSAVGDELGNSIRKMFNDDGILNMGKMVDGLFNKIWTFVSKALSSILSKLSSLLSKYGGWIGAIIAAVILLVNSIIKNDTFKQAIEGLKKAFSAIIGALQNIIGVVVSLFDSIAKVVGPILGIIIELVSGIFNIVASVLDFVAQAVKKILEPIMVILESIGEIVKSLFDLVSGIIGEIIETVGSILGTLMSIISAIIDPIVTVIKSILDPIIELFQSVFGLVGELLGSLFGALQTAFSALSSVFEAIGSILSLAAAFNPVIAIIKGVFQAIVDVLTPIFDFVNEVFGLISDLWSVVGAVFDAISMIIDAFKPVIDMVMELITGVIRGALNTLFAPIKWIFSKLSEGVKWIRNKLAPVFNGISKILGAIASFVGGIIDGINWLRNKIADISIFGWHPFEFLRTESASDEITNFTTQLQFNQTGSLGGNTIPVYGYGMTSSGFHTGVDIPMASGTPISTTAAGIVTDVGSNSVYGKFVSMLDTAGISHLFGHLSGTSVSRGDVILPGQLLGRSGNTGNSSEPHVHAETRRNGRFIDPTIVAKAESNNADVVEAIRIMTERLERKLEEVSQETEENSEWIREFEAKNKAVPAI